MAKKPQSKHYIREWRKHRGYSLERLAEMIGMTHQNLSKIERGLVPYNQVLLEELANAMTCAPSDLIIRDPLKADSILSIWNTLEPVERDQAEKVIRALRGTATGTNG